MKRQGENSARSEEIRLTAQQADMWSRGAFAVYLALVDAGRISPRIPGDGARQ
ncbi:hypothetical protein Nocox_30800 [Nonomuraea coxensis DSM 45129]|uniref:Uncharacterized protein n=1 Tax=Nonomuraea coxensis DSM 45129 TaxID=1122611 RepID=A0ABX8U7K1_9ACTN|nr:hypothetical protein [Nonomuraea coxensis]QYC43742.1 hypothetical protein Nocox_30800 [Nonomuraea coxensis DSM 45129]